MPTTFTSNEPQRRRVPETTISLRLCVSAARRRDETWLYGMLLEVDERAVLDADAERVDVIRLLVLRLVHQLVRPLEQFLRQLTGDGSSLGDVAEHQTDDADVHSYRLVGEARIVRRPVVAFDRFAEALGDDPRGAALIEIRDEEAELVAAEAGVQVLIGADVNGLLRDEVVGSHLLAQQPRDAIDNLVARRMPERVVVPLERVDIDQADGAPLPALLEREKRFDLLDETLEVHQPGLRIAMDAVGEIGDEILEVAGNAADGRVARRQLVAQPVQPVREAGRDRLNRLLLGLLPQPLVLHEDAVDRVEQRLLLAGGQMHPIAHPLMKVGARLRRGGGVEVEAFTHSHVAWPAAGVIAATNDVPSSRLRPLLRASASHD